MSLGWGTLTLLWTAMFTTLDVDIFRNENCFWYDINLSCFISSKEWKKQFLLIFRNNIYLLRSIQTKQMFLLTILKDYVKFIFIEPTIYALYL